MLLVKSWFVVRVEEKALAEIRLSKFSHWRDHAGLGHGPDPGALMPSSSRSKHRPAQKAACHLSSYQKDIGKRQRDAPPGKSLRTHCF